MSTHILEYPEAVHQGAEVPAELRNQYLDLCSRITEENNGKVLQYQGERSLSMFNNITDAVNCAIQLQIDCSKISKGSIGIGVHSGHISMVGDDIAGDGIDIATSIEALAVPGSVLISDRIYQEIKGYPDFPTISYGAIPIKNIKNQVGLYALTNEGLVVPDRGQLRNAAFKHKGKRLAGRRILITAAVILIAALLYGGITWSRQNHLNDIDPSTKSIAVLPFVNLSNDPEQEYFSDGMTADLLSQLAKINDLRVVSRTSVMQYKDTNKSLRAIASELDATHILEGSVMRHNDQVRIAVNLIEAKTDNRIWSMDFDKGIDDVLQVQREVSLEVVKLMKANLTQAEKLRVEKPITTNQQAYDYYQRGQNLIRRTEGTINQLDEAIRLFEQAIVLDPKFSLAFVGLAETYLSYATWGRIPPNQAIPQARSAAMKALQLDDEIGELYQILGAISLYEYDFRTAEEYLAMAAKLTPSYVETYSWLGQMQLLQGNLQEALSYFRKAQELDPLSTMYTGYIVWAYYLHGQFENAIVAANEVLQDRPTDSYVLWNLANVYMGMKDYDQAIEVFNRRNLGTYTNWALGYTYGLAGSKAKAQDVLDHHLQKVVTELCSCSDDKCYFYGFG